MNAQAQSVVIGRVKLPSGEYGPGAVWITGETIAAVTAGRPAEADLTNSTVIDVGDAFVLPGAVDAHVHCYSALEEGMAVASASAVAGGVTTIVEMPFDADGPINNLDRLTHKLALVDAEAVGDVALLGTLAPDGGWREAATLAANGVVGFKLSLFHTDSFRFPRIDDAELLEAFAAIAETGLTVCVHAENNEIVQKLSAAAAEEDPLDPLTHVRTRPPVSETLGVLTAMEIAHATGVRLHLCHMSTPRAIDLATWFAANGTDVTAETCTHYLTFTADDMNTHGARLKINPPLRSRDEVEGMWQRVGAGEIQLLTSDHAPWPLERKTNPEILKNSSGAPGVEMLPTMCLGQALQRDPSATGLFDRVVTALTSAPADRYGIGHRKGRLAPGHDADLMVFTPDPTHTVTADQQHSNAGWTPYEGMQPGGRVTLAVSRGEVVWDAATGAVAGLGRGRLVRPEV
ncbi:MAG: amidohydrolase family protein [Dermatophilus congolensis]|nr:amidohydrolase family protein [Dermatophilus congolensis]